MCRIIKSSQIIVNYRQIIALMAKKYPSYTLVMNSDIDPPKGRVSFLGFVSRLFYIFVSICKRLILSQCFITLFWVRIRIVSLFHTDLCQRILFRKLDSKLSSLKAHLF